MFIEQNTVNEEEKKRNAIILLLGKRTKNTKEQKLIFICGCKPQHVYLLLLFLSNKRMFAGTKKNINGNRAMSLSLSLYMRYIFFPLDYFAQAIHALSFVWFGNANGILWYFHYCLRFVSQMFSLLLLLLFLLFCSKMSTES